MIQILQTVLDNLVYKIFYGILYVKCFLFWLSLYSLVQKSHHSRYSHWSLPSIGRSSRYGFWEDVSILEHDFVLHLRHLSLSWRKFHLVHHQQQQFCQYDMCNMLMPILMHANANVDPDPDATFSGTLRGEWGVIPETLCRTSSRAQGTANCPTRKMPSGHRFGRNWACHLPSARGMVGSHEHGRKGLGRGSSRYFLRV